jgi:sigma-B regulation protein RsbU (phosphoserine phosphatase)
MKNRYVYYIPLLLLFIIAAVYQARFTQGRLRYLLQMNERARLPFGTGYAGPDITFVNPEAAEAGVHKGDRLLAVEGQTYTGRNLLFDKIYDARVGETLTVRVRHQASEGLPDEEKRITVRTAAENAAPSVWDWLFVLILSIATPTFCLLLGFFVVTLRPRDPLAWLLLGLMLSFGQVILGSDALEWKGWVRDLMVGYQTFFQSAWGLWMLLFGIYFPERWNLDRRLPWLKWLFIIPMLVIILKNTVIAVASLRNFVLADSLSRAFYPYRTVEAILIMASVGFFFAAIGWKMGSATNPDAKRRLKLLLYGTQISLGPSFLLVIYSVVKGVSPHRAAPPWITIPLILLFLLFPLTFAYVIVVHRAMDVRVVIRQGLQYALAKGGVRVLQVILVASIIIASILLAESPRTNRPQKIIVISLSVLLVLLIKQGAERLRVWVDRRFFREAYNAEQILNDLSQDVRTMVETGPLLETVAQRISESLHVPRVALLLKENGSYRPAHALGFTEGEPPVSFPEQATTVERLRRDHEPLMVYADDPDSWVHSQPEMEGERAMLEKLDTQLLLPLNVKEKLPGFISLGPKQSEEPYSNTDLRLLQSVATQTGLALENSQLSARIASEIAQRERLNREVEIAREVQERLFPQDHPTVMGLDYCGACRPALGVGGDYYDFLLLPNENFGIAIGDVSGKGISAALLMASLQASLRGQAVQGTDDLANLMSNVNRLVYDASAENRYATFFYAQYKPQSRTLSYVNAGHNPPMIFRQKDGEWEILRLEEGGCVVGLLPNFPYVQASVTLQPGDLFLGFTDGISEAMNPVDEEWGEEAMMEEAKSRYGMTAADLLASLVKAADEFANGAKQHDDMTLIVVLVI